MIDVKKLFFPFHSCKVRHIFSIFTQNSSTKISLNIYRQHETQLHERLLMLIFNSAEQRMLSSRTIFSLDCAFNRLTTLSFKARTCLKRHTKTWSEWTKKLWILSSIQKTCVLKAKMINYLRKIKFSTFIAFRCSRKSHKPTLKSSLNFNYA